MREVWPGGGSSTGEHYPKSGQIFKKNRFVKVVKKNSNKLFQIPRGGEGPRANIRYPNPGGAEMTVGKKKSRAPVPFGSVLACLGSAGHGHGSPVTAVPI